MPIGPGMPPRGSCSNWAPWCAFQSGYGPSKYQSWDFDYSKFKAYNETHLQWKQYSVLFKEVIDEFWIVRDEKKSEPLVS